LSALHAQKLSVDSYSDNPKILPLLRDPKIYFRVQKTQAMDRIQSQLNPAYAVSLHDPFNTPELIGIPVMYEASEGANRCGLLGLRKCSMTVL
jgi:hypothetical protein